MFDDERKQAYEAVVELCGKAGLKKGQIMVVGCSSSEICGDRIGSNSNLDAAEAVFDGIYAALNEHGVYLAAQCCEHLNRAIVVEREAARGAADPGGARGLVWRRGVAGEVHRRERRPAVLRRA